MNRESYWYRLGRKWALYRHARRQGLNPLDAYQAVLAAEIVTHVSEFVSGVVEKVIRDVSSSSPFAFPPLPPTKKVERTYPFRPPEPRVPHHSPSFTGVRVELGGDQA